MTHPDSLRVPVSTTVVFVGIQGSGKGTQARLLEAFFRDRGERVVRVETGERFRALAERDVYTAHLVRAALQRGELLPEFLAVHLWGAAFVDQLRGAEHLITDGFPRSALEAAVLHSAFRFYQRFPVVAIHLAIDQDEAVKRLQGRKRGDDTPDAIRTRLEHWRKRAAILLSFFREHAGYHLIEIDGSRPVDAVHAAVVAAVRKVYAYHV